MFTNPIIRNFLQQLNIKMLFGNSLRDNNFLDFVELLTIIHNVPIN